MIIEMLDCGFLMGTLVNHGLIDQNLYFEIFNPTPFWNKAKPIIEGMRNGKSDSHYCIIAMQCLIQSTTDR